MRLVIRKNYDEICKLAAQMIKNIIDNKPTTILGLATGSTPIGVYKELIKMNKSNEIDFSKVTTVNLDEYIGLGEKNLQSYRYFMNENLFNNININKSNTYIPNGLAENIQQEAKNYDNKIDELGGIDLQILGIGNNGHIAFNEPSDVLIAGTHLTNLAESTIKANSRFFDSIDQVPKKALTMGLAQIMKSKKILLLVKGNDKAQVVKELLSEKITTKNPSTMLKMHKDITVIIDEDMKRIINF